MKTPTGIGTTKHDRGGEGGKRSQMKIVKKVLAPAIPDLPLQLVFHFFTIPSMHSCTFVTREEKTRIVPLEMLINTIFNYLADNNNSNGKHKKRKTLSTI